MVASSLAVVTAHAQYTGSNSSINNSPVIYTVGYVNGPHNALVQRATEDFSFVKQVQGSIFEPCPYSSPYQHLYDHKWTVILERIIVLTSGQQATLIINKNSQTGNSTWTRNSDGSQFKRELGNNTTSDDRLEYTIQW